MDEEFRFVQAEVKRTVSDLVKVGGYNVDPMGLFLDVWFFIGVNFGLFFVSKIYHICSPIKLHYSPPGCRQSQVSKLVRRPREVHGPALHRGGEGNSCEGIGIMHFELINWDGQNFTARILTFVGGRVDVRCACDVQPRRCRRNHPTLQERNRLTTPGLQWGGGCSGTIS